MPNIITVQIDADEWAVVPRVPTVSTEMKIKFLGMFSWDEEAPYYDEHGVIHDHVARHAVPWDLCKAIFKQMADHWISAAPPPEPVPTNANLVREIDVLLNGEAGAAPQASLCDLVAQLRSVVNLTGKPALSQPEPVQPVPTGERLPTEADADCFGQVWGFSRSLKRWLTVRLMDYHALTSFKRFHSHWQPTGLQRPTEVKA